MTTECKWMVWLVVLPNGAGGLKRYVPACECGWSGGQFKGEGDAALLAYEHATGKLPPTCGKRRRTKPSDDDTLPMFDTKPYEKKGSTNL